MSSARHACLLLALVSGCGARSGRPHEDRPAGSASHAEPLSESARSATAAHAPPKTRVAEPNVVPLLELARSAVDTAIVDVDSLIATRTPTGSGSTCVDENRYLTLRRHVAQAAPFLRIWARAAAVPLIGPARVSSEGVGSLGNLDSALSTQSCDVAAEQLDQIRSALRLASVELRDPPATLEMGLQTLSDTAYDLGLILVESHPNAPATSRAALADVVGTLDALKQGTTSVSAQLREQVANEANEVELALAPIASALDQKTELRQVSGRASLVVSTGRAGAALRSMGTKAGVKLRAPYRPLGVEGDLTQVAVSALTLPAPRRGIDPSVSALGKRLFGDRRLSKNNVRSCADCHDAKRGYSDGHRVPSSLIPASPIVRNTPTLLYSAMQASQRWDGRVITPEDQALGVLFNVAEMGSNEGEVEAVIRGDSSYRDEFSRVFPDGVTAKNVVRAMAEFLKTLSPASSPIDRFARGDSAALSPDESRGFDVFSGVGRCSRCHIPPTFAGARPTDFSAAVYSVIGVPDRPKHGQIDADLGREAVTHRPADAHAFKSPTLRNLASTAPYFHNGAFASIEEVVDFYDKGGGRAAGAEVPNQDPDVRALSLTPEEKRALLVFLKTGLLDAPSVHP